MQTLEQLAELTNSSFSGDKNIELNSVATLTNATSGQISFVSNPKYINQLEESNASAVILSKKLAKKYNGNALINDDPYLTFARVLNVLCAPPASAETIHKSAVIGDNVTLHSSVHIAANVVIEDGVTIEEGVTICAACYIGKDSHIASGVHLYPHVTLYKDTVIGKNTIIHSGAIIGADGFGFAPTPEKEWFKILQIGNVEIGSDVEIGANVSIDRSALGTTIINDGVKLDNLVHIGHNVKLGKHTVIAAATVVGGSTSVGEYCQIGGAVAIAGHINIVDNVIITGKSMVMKPITKAGVYSSGVIAEENKIWRKNAARFRKLDEIAKKVIHLDKKLNEK